MEKQINQLTDLEVYKNFLSYKGTRTYHLRNLEEEFRNYGNNSCQKYSQSLKKLAALYGEDHLKDLVRNNIRRRFMEKMKHTKCPPSEYGKNDTWIYWDLAKQYYYFMNPEESNPNKYDLADPVTSEKLQEEMIERHVGWEIFHPNRKYFIEMIDRKGFDDPEVLQYFINPIKSDQRLNSRQYQELGELLLSKPISFIDQKKPDSDLDEYYLGEILQAEINSYLDPSAHNELRDFLLPDNFYLGLESAFDYFEIGIDRRPNTQEDLIITNLGMNGFSPKTSSPAITVIPESEERFKENLMEGTRHMYNVKGFISFSGLLNNKLAFQFKHFEAPNREIVFQNIPFESSLTITKTKFEALPHISTSLSFYTIMITEEGIEKMRNTLNALDSNVPEIEA